MSNYTHAFELEDDFPFAQMGSDYASGEYTISEMCQMYDINRDIFYQIKKSAPNTWRKGQAPNLWWDELDDQDEDIIEDIKDKKKANTVEGKARSEMTKERSRAAEKWWVLEDALDEASEAFEEWNKDYTNNEPSEINIRVGRKEKMGSTALVLPLHDVHYGKYATESEVGADYNREIAEKRAHKAVDKILEQALRLGNVEEIITVCGTSDFLHIDSDKPARTTNGTPQDADGTIGEIIAGGQALSIELIDKMRAIAPTDVHFVPGNHDKVSSQWMHTHQKAYYKDVDNVTFSSDRRTRQYWSYGVTNGCFFHGDVRKSQLKEFGNIFGREFGFNDHNMVISGHKHFKMAEDRSGLQFYQTPSISGSDLWHDKNLYSSGQGVEAYLLHQEEGLINSPCYYFK